MEWIGEWGRDVHIPFPTLRPLPSIKSPAFSKASPAYPPAVRVPASTNPSTLFQMMLETKFILYVVL